MPSTRCRSPAIAPPTRDAVRDARRGPARALPELADDPHLLLPDRRASSTRNVRGGTLPRVGASHRARCSRAANGLDLVGIYAAGPIYRGFANSEGQRNWHATTTFNLQWSLYHRTDKAVKIGVRRASTGGTHGVRARRWRARASGWR